jgi:hypothetical protein
MDLRVAQAIARTEAASVAPVPRVTSGGRDLLLVARALVLRGPYPAVEGILAGPTRMAGVGRETMRLFEETLALGCTRALARHGGWRRHPRLGADGVKVGRLWDVRPASPLAFSRYSYALGEWLVAQPLGARTVAPFRETPLRPGDQLVAYLACALVEGQPLAGAVAQQPGVRAAALAWLGFPAMLAAVEADPPGPDALRDSFEALAAEGGVIVEGLSDDLATRTVDFERAKGEFVSPTTLLRAGEARDLTLGLLLDALDRAGRWDLATFLVEATAALVPPASGTSAVQGLVSRLARSAPLRERAAALHASAAHWRHAARLSRHHEAMRTVRHFEEGYAGAQLLLTRWELLGAEGFQRAANVLVAFEALEQG